jgi:5,10-methylenetetrahydrofolate reductase
MVFPRLLKSGAFPVALEITPPQKPSQRVLLRRARLLGTTASAINVIQRPGRMSSLDASTGLLAAGVAPAWHLVQRGRTREAIRAEIGAAHAAGITQVLCIRGDDGDADTADTPTIREVVATVAELMPGTCLGATFNQYAEDGHAALRNLLPKLRAGASYVQTQPVFDATTFLVHADRLRQASPETQIVAMVMPLIAPGSAERIAGRLRIEPPAAGQGEEAAWEAFATIVASLRESPLVDGLAIMTFEMDPLPETGARILTALSPANTTGEE